MTPVEDLDGLEQALERLEAAGARGYDSPACDCVRGLLSRADQLQGGARGRLLSRAAHHLGRLAERYERERARAALRIEGLRNQGVSTEGALARALERGELSRIHRAARRVGKRAPRSALIVREPVVPTAPTPDRRRLRRQSANRYEDSLSELVASVALARCAQAVPEDAGPYNPRLIAHRTLDTMRRISPLYLRVQLERLDELGSLLQLPEPPPDVPAKRAKPRRKKRDQRA